MNERNTEKLVRDLLKKRGYENNEDIIIEEQQSKHPQIKRLLKNASKSGEGVGRPEFIIRHRKQADLVIIIECKASKKNHKSETLKNAKDFALDGALHYGSFVSKNYSVISIGVSGEDNPLIDCYLQTDTLTKDLKLQDILPFDDFYEMITLSPEVRKAREKELLAFADKLHNYIRDYAKLTEQEKPVLVGACLVALTDTSFRKNFYDYEHDGKRLSKSLIEAVTSKLETENLSPDKVKIVEQKLKNNFIDHVNLTTVKDGTSPLFQIIERLASKSNSLTTKYNNFDILGMFYGEFLSYTAGDKKGLGIVLTPQHITELMAELVEINSSSTVLDICTGTGGFLISSMFKMLQGAGGSPEKIKNIKSKQLIGVEQEPNMWLLGCLNMVLRGDGKSNLYQSNCFSLRDELKKKTATAGLLNPPYSQKGEGLDELSFIEYMMDCLAPNSLGAAIVPMNTGINTGNKIVRDSIMSKHSLVGVLTMPPDLFPNVGVNTQIQIWRAYVPHTKPTYFSQWKDDGFIKTKSNGRCDYYKKWDTIRTSWLSEWNSKKEIPGRAVLQNVGPTDEWCAEAYLVPAKEELSDSSFAEKSFSFFLQRKSQLFSAKINEVYQGLDTSNWKFFNILDLFEISTDGKYSLREAQENPGDVPYVSASENNNGISCLTSLPASVSGNTLTLAKDGAPGVCFYQRVPYTALTNVFILSSKGWELNERRGIFLSTLIEKYRPYFNYGRKINNERLKQIKLKLPVTKEGTPDWEYMDKTINKWLKVVEEL